MSGFAYDPAPDSTLSLLRDGYGFISGRCRKLGVDAFETRLLGQRTVCCRGADAARLFYDETRMQRQGAAPKAIRKTLLGDGGVQGLDGDAHRHRKRMFMSLMTAERLSALAGDFEKEWREQAWRWADGEAIVLYERSQEMLCRAVCRWSGVPLSPKSVPRRTADLAAMIDGGGSLGARHWRARLARRRSERWLARLVSLTRAGYLSPADGTALAVVATHRDLAGRYLDERIAAVELLNVLRPTVAIATFVTFAGLALHQFPDAASNATDWSEREIDAFVHEVRRFYPFFPFACARACRDFRWRGYRFPSGRRILLDLYGTNHDPALWNEPDEFRPARFVGHDPDPYAFIPQGGGNHHEHHRCAGEWVTLALMKVSLTFLTSRVSYDVPSQDLRVSLRRMPTRPASGFLIVRRC